MQDYIFSELIQIFQQFFLENISSSFSQYSHYASSIFYSIAIIEMVIAGLLISISSNLTIYTFISKIIKISAFFFFIIHFGDIFELFANSIRYIALNTRTDINNIPIDGDTFKLSSLWDFNNPNNYVTQGLNDYFNNLNQHLHTKTNAHHPPEPSQNPTDITQYIPTPTTDDFLNFAQMCCLSLTGMLAIANIILFYFAGLITLLFSPFGQLPICSGLFQSTFEKFISTGLRLMVFIIIFILYSLFYNKLSTALPEIFTINSTNTSTMNNPVQPKHPVTIISFLLSLFGLLLCWFIPQEISRRTNYFNIPIKKDESPVTPIVSPNIHTASSPTISAMQTYISPANIPNNLSLAQNTGLQPSTNNINNIANNSTNATPNKEMATTQVSVQTNNSSQSQTISKTKNNNLKQHASFIKQHFSNERATKLRQNFHSTMDKNKK